MPLGNRLRVAAMAVIYCSTRLQGPSNVGKDWAESELNKKEIDLRQKARDLQTEIYADLTKQRPKAAGTMGRYAAAMRAYDDTYKDHKFGRCMAYASITGRFIKGLGESCHMVTVLMNEKSDPENEHVFIVMGDSLAAGQDCASWDDSTVVCDEWISHHPDSQKHALGNVGIYRGKAYADELGRLGYQTKTSRVIEVQRI